MREIIIRAPDDMHVHLREGDMLRNVLRYTADVFPRGLVMPNTSPPVLTGVDAVRYREQILGVDPRFVPLMTIKLTPQTMPRIIEDARMLGVTAGKLYPEGVTTNSEDGVRELRAMTPVFEAMQESGMVLSLHGERVGVFCMDRETAFLEDLWRITTEFPKLKVVLEHVTTAKAVQAVFGMPDRVAATITAHHLVLTLDDVVGGMLDPHAFCKPIAKTPMDRFALRMAAVHSRASYRGKFFFGSDTAPHLRGRKECSSGCAGVFSAPCALEVLADVFEREGELDQLEFFASEAGARFYGLPLNQEVVMLSRDEWEVPSEIAGVVPFMAGRRLPWRFVDRHFPVTVLQDPLRL